MEAGVLGNALEGVEDGDDESSEHGDATEKMKKWKIARLVTMLWKLINLTRIMKTKIHPTLNEPGRCWSLPRPSTPVWREPLLRPAASWRTSRSIATPSSPWGRSASRTRTTP